MRYDVAGWGLVAAAGATVLLLVVTLANGGGPASIGFVMGILFVAVGVGRYWIASRQLR